MKKEIKERIATVRRGEVPDGYRRAKLGIAPMVWKDCTLGDILTQRKTLMCISEDAPLLSFTIEEGVIDPKDKKSNKRDFLIKDMATKKFALTEVGDIIYNPANLKFGAIHRNNLKRGVVSPIYGIFYGAPNSKFMGYFLHDQRFIDYAKTYTEGSVEKLKTLSADAFLKLKVTVPSLPEQEKIAEILATCDRVIELKRQLLEEKYRQKQWLMQTLLDPNSTTVVEKRLGDVCSINDSGIDGISDDSEIFYIDIASVDNGKVLFPEFPIKLQDAPVRARRTFKRGDILMSTVRPYLHAFAFVDFDADDYVASTGFSILRAKNGFSSRLVYQLLFTAEMDKQYSSVLVGSNYPALNTSDVENLVVCIPENYEKQEAVANALEAADRQISLLTSEIEAWQQKKKALMQLLLTGLVRV